MESSFGNSAKIILPETQKILAQCPEVRKVLFLPEICPLECSTGREECLTDELAVFLQVSVSSGKPLQNINLYLLPKKKFYEFFLLVTWILFLTPLPKTSAVNPEFLHSKSEKNVKPIFFRKNSFASTLFAGQMECGVNNTSKHISPKNQQFVAHWPLFRKFWFLPKFFPRSVRLRRTPRMPSWFVQVLFWSFCGRESSGLDTAGRSTF